MLWTSGVYCTALMTNANTGYGKTSHHMSKAYPMKHATLRHIHNMALIGIDVFLTQTLKHNRSSPFHSLVGGSIYTSFKRDWAHHNSTLNPRPTIWLHWYV